MPAFRFAAGPVRCAQIEDPGLEVLGRKVEAENLVAEHHAQTDFFGDDAGTHQFDRVGAREEKVTALHQQRRVDALGIHAGLDFLLPILSPGLCADLDDTHLVGRRRALIAFEALARFDGGQKITERRPCPARRKRLRNRQHRCPAAPPTPRSPAVAPAPLPCRLRRAAATGAQ